MSFAAWVLAVGMGFTGLFVGACLAVVWGWRAGIRVASQCGDCKERRACPKCGSMYAAHKGQGMTWK